MDVKWSKLLLKAGFWLCAEVVLSSAGLDDLANYSEFILQNQNAAQQAFAICIGSIVV